MSLSTIQTAQLRKIASAHNNDPANPDFSKVAMVKEKQVSALVKAGFIVINPTIAANAAGEVQARATQAGVDYLKLAETGAVAPATKPTFTLVSFTLPEVKRGNPGNGGRSIYPFEQMQAGQAFFVAANEGEDAKEAVKRMASVVSAANKRFITESRPKVGPNGEPILTRGKPSMEHRYSKHFSVRVLADGAPFGMTGKAGAVIGCDSATGA